MTRELIGHSIGLHPLDAAVADPGDDAKDDEIERDGDVEPKPVLSLCKKMHVRYAEGRELTYIG